MFQLKKGNLIDTVRECLQEHQVNLSSPPGNFYLIEARARSSAATDFKDTYPEADKFKQDLAAKLFGKNPSDETYGVLVTPRLQYAFAFNRRFADLNKRKTSLDFIAAEDVLLKAAEGTDLSESSDLGLVEDLTQSQVIGPTVFRYAAVGRKNREVQQTQDIATELNRNSMLDRIRASYSKREIVLGPEKERFFLIEVPYETNTLVDFSRTYRQEADKFKEQVAKKIFGTKRKTNNYGLILDQDLTIRFAFNERFAKYDSSQQDVVFLSVEEAILEQSDQKDLSKTQTPTPPRRPWAGPGLMTLRYASVGKQE